MRRITCIALGAAASTLLGGGFLSLAAQAAAPTTPTTPAVTVVASGLNNPRGLAFSDGKLYVSQAGSGGTDCPKGYVGPERGPLCVGTTGALTEIANGHTTNVLSGLISESDLPGGLAAEGIMDVAVTRTGLRALYAGSVVGTLVNLPPGTSFTPTDNAAIRAQFGKLTAVIGGGNAVLADVGDADYSWAAVNQNLVPTQFPDANPNSMTVVGDTTYVADAGSNTVDAVTGSGQVQQLAFLPSSTRSDGTPTCIAVGPGHRDLYIGQLAPFAGPGNGKVYRYNLATHKLTVWKTGFGAVDGCGFDGAGNFYAVEFQHAGFFPGPTGFGSGAGDIVKIAPSGRRSLLGVGALNFPQGFATDGKGGIYVSNNSIFTATPPGPGGPTGEVVRVGP